MSFKSRLFFYLFFATPTSLVFAQGHGSSPYSIIGIGEIAPETVASQDMMGGTGVSFANSFYVNQLNPALLVKNRSIGFNKYVSFNIGLNGAYKTIQQGNKITDNFGMNMNNFSLVFPIKNKWAMGVSMRPYSVSDYTSVKTIDFAGSSEQRIQEIKNQGGLSRIAFTNSFELAKGLYFGVDGQYNYGYISVDTSANMKGVASYQRYSSRTNLKGVSARTGLAYQQKINKKWKVNVGSFYQLGRDLKGDQIRTYSILTDNGEGPAYDKVPDTLGIRNVTSGIPSSYKVGLSLEKTYNWVFAADYGKTLWTGVNQFDPNAKNMMNDATEMNVGMEWMPNSSSSKYLDLVFYRLGFKHVNSPYTVNGSRVIDNSFSLGVSLPMGKSGYFDVAVMMGRRGSNAAGQIQENYTKISLNVSLMSVWFYKQRID
ncbi:MAG: hypothetical protein LCH67_13505 [Bacteroidetes bacterium]|nr:hypothetical protein [Bacteroidota bacterium]